MSIRNSVSYSLRESDIHEALGNKTKVIPYDTLKYLGSIHQLLQPYGNAIILYRHGPNTGHWVGIMYTIDEEGRKIIEVFDPYGTGVDRQFENGQMIDMHRYLSRLLLFANMPIHYNHFQLQKMTNNVNTCGRHCVYRILHRDMPLEEYVSRLEHYRKSHGYPDYDNLLVNLLASS